MTEGETGTQPRSSIQLQVTPELEKRLVEVIRQDFASAKEARLGRDYGITSKGEKIGFDKRMKQVKDLYHGDRIPKEEPWRFASNRSLRIATAIVDTLHARLLPTVVNENLLRFRPGEVTDVPKVERVSKLMEWWLFVRSPIQHFYDIWAKKVIAYGDSLTETSFKVDIIDKGRTVTKQIVGEDGSQLIEEDGTPSEVKFRDVEPFETTVSKTFMSDQVFLQKGSRDIQKDPVIIEEEVPFRELLQGELQGQFVNVSNLLRSMIPLDRVEGSSAEENDRLRDIRIRNIPIRVQRWYGTFDADGDGFAEEVRVTVALTFSLYLGGVAVKDLTYSGRRPLDFTKFSDRIDRPDDLDGEGVVEKVRELAEEIDAIFNQLTDANTLSIMRPGFYDPSGDLEVKTLKLAPNRLTPVSDPSRNVFFPDISVQITQLLEAIRLVLEFIERLTAASAFVFGKESEIVGGSGTATRTNTITQSADIRFNIPANRVRRGAASIVGNHLDILQLNLPPGLESRVLGEKGEPVFESGELVKEGIAGKFDAYLLPDPSQGSKQLDRDLAGMIYSIFIQNPFVVSDPSKFYRLSANLLKAWDMNPIELLGPEPLMDDIDDPQDENTLIIQGDFARVRAQLQENHILHMQEHMALLESPSLAQVPQRLLAQVTQFTQQHILEHQQMMQLVIALSQQLAGGGNAGSIGGPGGQETNKGAPRQPGLNQAPGPLGQALDFKRQGESRANEGSF